MNFEPHAKVFTQYDAHFLREMHISTDDVCPTCGGARKESHWQVIACSACQGTGRRPAKLHHKECPGGVQCDCKVAQWIWHRNTEDDGA